MNPHVARYEKIVAGHAKTGRSPVVRGFLRIRKRLPGPHGVPEEIAVGPLGRGVGIAGDHVTPHEGPAVPFIQHQPSDFAADSGEHGIKECLRHDESSCNAVDKAPRALRYKVSRGCVLRHGFRQKIRVFQKKFLSSAGFTFLIMMRPYGRLHFRFITSLMEARSGLWHNMPDSAIDRLSGGAVMVFRDFFRHDAGH